MSDAMNQCVLMLKIIFRKPLFITSTGIIGLIKERSPVTFFHAFDIYILSWWTRFKPSWWRHQMETFSALLAICAGNSPVPGEFPTQRPVTRNFDVYFDLRPDKRFTKQSWGWWFETLSHSLWRHRNANTTFHNIGTINAFSFVWL